MDDARHKSPQERIRMAQESRTADWATANALIAMALMMRDNYLYPKRWVCGEETY